MDPSHRRSGESVAHKELSSWHKTRLVQEVLMLRAELEAEIARHNGRNRRPTSVRSRRDRNVLATVRATNAKTDAELRTAKEVLEATTNQLGEITAVLSGRNRDLGLKNQTILKLRQELRHRESDVTAERSMAKVQDDALLASQQEVATTQAKLQSTLTELGVAQRRLEGSVATVTEQGLELESQQASITVLSRKLEDAENRFATIHTAIENNTAIASALAVQLELTGHDLRWESAQRFQLQTLLETSLGIIPSPVSQSAGLELLGTQVPTQYDEFGLRTDVAQTDDRPANPRTLPERSCRLPRHFQNFSAADTNPGYLLCDYTPQSLWSFGKGDQACSSCPARYS